MADSMATGVTVNPLQLAETSAVSMEEQYHKMAQAVAALLSPTITEAVDRAVAAGITQLWKEMGEHAKWLSCLRAPPLSPEG